MKTLVISMLFLALLISAAQVQAQTWSAAEKEVLQAMEDCGRAYMEEDLEAVAANCYHDDYVRFRRPAPTTFNKADVLDSTQMFWADNDVVRWTAKPLAIRIVGNVAVVHFYVYAMVQDKEGKRRFQRNRHTDVWVKEEGKWSKIADHGGSDLPPGN
jgi:ketosteroid isomerase-like protein